MAKLWPSLSVLLILAMLLFLVPAVIFAPQNVAAAEDVVQEVESTFTFNETAPGDWHTFLAGNATIQGAGLCLEQYTRPYVLLPSSLAGCGFRNYTAGSGTAAGDLSGTLSLAWLTFRFNQQYSGPGALYYPGATDFGFMAGRGHIGEDLTFVFIADLDCDDDMTNAGGKGFMVSTEETGAFAGHKVIGDFEVVKTGIDYTWSLHLRNYAPNEVYYKGIVTVEGGVMQEQTDPIHAPLALLNFTQDGPEVTPSNTSTDFEEIAWGKDPFKTVMGGPLGSGGNMDITRNGALYLEVNVGENWVRIQATEACKLHIDDIYDVTGNDKSSYGHAYYFLLLQIPDQTLPIGGFFNQTGYTFYPFGMHLNSTDCYAGAETFALAQIQIESSVGNAIQTSIDHSYGLNPHPKIDSVTPNTGIPGETNKMVTIKGKYFLRADNTHPSSGLVSFGEGITVNSYTIKNSSEIDNEIVADITISACAAGPRPVSVTSCFGYHDGSGEAPYKTGSLADAFDVPVTGDACLEGHVSFAGRSPDKWVEPFVVNFFEGGGEMTCSPMIGITNETGVFRLWGVVPGTYDIGIKNWTCLSEMETGVAFSADETIVVDFCNSDLRQGDSDNDDWITGADRSILYTGWGTQKGSPGYNSHADFDRDDWLTGADRSMMYTYWGQCGALA